MMRLFEILLENIKNIKMTEHNKLKIICDIIELEVINKNINRHCFDDKNRLIDWNYEIWDVRALIFTQEFMDKLKTQLYKKHNDWLFWLWEEILENLDNITDYLYNLLELWENVSNADNT